MSSLHQPASLACVFALGVSVTTLARADPAAQARFHDERARRAFDKRQLETALTEFFLAQRLAPNPRTDFNIAVCLEQLGRSEDAFMYFREFLASDASRSSDLKELREYAEKTVRTLESRIARVAVETTTPGASVYVDKREHGTYGVTPRTIAVPAGEHRVWVELAGYRTASAQVVAKTGQEVRVELRPERILGVLLVQSPAAGQVSVRAADGSTVAAGPAPLRRELPPGSYQLVLNAPGHLPWQGLAEVRADETVEYRANPDRSPPPTGDVTVTANVSGAMIELDGKGAGFTPGVLRELEVGRHRIAITNEGLLPWTGEVQVEPNERAWVTVNLDRSATTVHSPATWVAGGIGIFSLVAGGVMAGLAANQHSRFEHAAPQDRADARDLGRTYNVAADVLFGTGIVALAASVGLYFGTAHRQGGESTATVARDKR